MQETPGNHETTLTRRIRERLDALDLSATAAAERAGLNRGAIRDILDGKTSSPRLKTLAAIAAVLGTSVNYLSGEVDDERPPTAPPGDLDIPVIGPAAAGVFREEPQRQVVRTVQVPRSSEHPDARHFAVIAGDNSMDNARPVPINEGAIACLVDLEDADLPVESGKIYLVERRTPEGLLERSLRTCSASRSMISFNTSSRTEQHDPIEVKRDSLEKDMGVRVSGLVYALYYPIEA